MTSSLRGGGGTAGASNPFPGAYKADQEFRLKKVDAADRLKQCFTLVGQKRACLGTMMRGKDRCQTHQGSKSRRYSPTWTSAWCIPSKALTINGPFCFYLDPVLDAGHVLPVYRDEVEDGMNTLDGWVEMLLQAEGHWQAVQLQEDRFDEEDLGIKEDEGEGNEGEDDLDEGDVTEGEGVPAGGSPPAPSEPDEIEALALANYEWEEYVPGQVTSIPSTLEYSQPVTNQIPAGDAILATREAVDSLFTLLHALASAPTVEGQRAAKFGQRQVKHGVSVVNSAIAALADLARGVGSANNVQDQGYDDLSTAILELASSVSRSQVIPLPS